MARYFPPIEAIVLFGESVRWETNLQILIDVLMSNGRLDAAPVAFPAANLPILACNTDMVWMAEAAMPRFGHGAFLHCLEQIYEKLSGRDLNYTAVVGKPSEITYYYAEEMLQSHAESIGASKNIRRMYAVGDNLDTDIYGANLFNKLLTDNKKYKDANHVKGDSGQLDLVGQRVAEFDANSSYVSTAESISSILVQTGVYRGNKDDTKISGSSNLAHKDIVLDEMFVRPHHVVENVLEAVKLVFKIEKFS
jgi:HAD superfamily hydrolase (TIGR01456 family)